MFVGTKMLVVAALASDIPPRVLQSLQEGCPKSEALRVGRDSKTIGPTAGTPVSGNTDF